MSDPQENTGLMCGVCRRQLRNPHMLPCLHVFCLRCLQDECCEKSRDKFFCPLCVSPEGRQLSHSARPWYSFEKCVENEAKDESLKRRQEELPASENGRQDENVIEDGFKRDNSSPYSESSEENSRRPSLLESAVLFPCTMHADRLADTYCTKCQQLACHKCVSSFHRRCQHLTPIGEAVEAKRHIFDSIHSQIAENLLRCEVVTVSQCKKVREIEDMRRSLILSIKAHRTELINLVLAKEKSLTDEANKLLDGLKHEEEVKGHVSENLAKSCLKQLSVMELALSVKGEGEFLPLLPSLASRVAQDAKTVAEEVDDDLSTVTFVKDAECLRTVRESPLGALKSEASKDSAGGSTLSKDGESAGGEKEADLALILVTSFHGGARDDTTEPLLTDLVLLANGDVILTDRDNRCVKKFNQTGKLLTRVAIEAVPCRIAAVSHGRAVVSVMTKKRLYFLSLVGTVRVLHSVSVKKIYSFLTSLGGGVLAAGTNHCDGIDLLTERGQLIRTVFADKPDKAIIARPLYLSPVLPHGRLSDVSRHHDTHNNNNSNNKDNNNISKIKSSVNGSQNERTGVSNSSPLTPASRLASIEAPSSSSVQDDGALNSATVVAIPDILVSDSGKRLVFRIRQDGTVAFTLKSSDSLSLECPLGVTVHETGLALLADRDSNSILALDADGNFRKKLLTSEDGLSKPCGIFAGYRGHVAVSQVDGMVKIYRSQRVFS